MSKIILYELILIFCVDMIESNEQFEQPNDTSDFKKLNITSLRLSNYSTN